MALYQVFIIFVLSCLITIVYCVKKEKEATGASLALLGVVIAMFIFIYLARYFVN